MICLCPHCAKPMLLVRAIGREVGWADLHIYECKSCGLNLTEAVPIGPKVAYVAKPPTSWFAPSPPADRNSTG